MIEDIEIYPYKVVRRTEYSKPRLINIETNEDITKTHGYTLEKILEDYNNQLSNPCDYFIIEDDCIFGLKEPCEKLDNLFIPEGVRKIRNLALSKGIFFRVNIPDTVSIIDSLAFSNCSNLEAVCIPDNVQEINYAAFEKCINLKFAKLPSTLQKLNSKVFYMCESLNNVVIPDSVFIMGNEIFYDCKSLTNITLSKNLTGMGIDCFSSCINLKNITLPDKLNDIGMACFYECKKLEELTIPDNVCNIDEAAFAKCENLKSIKLPKSLKKVKASAFQDCKALESIVLPDNVSEIHGEAFSYTDRIKEINVPKNLNGVYSRPFLESKINTLVFNHDLESLEVEYGHDLISKSEINKLIINNTVKVITPDAFRNGGHNIKTIDYQGTKKEFKEFQKKNKELFKCFVKLKEVNIIEDKKNDVKEKVL